MKTNFEEVMLKKTDAELLKIVNEQREDYQIEAVEAAEKELENRNLSEEQINTATEELEKTRQFDEERANEPLNGGFKILTAMFPGVIQIFFSKAFISKGYDRKAKELVQWTMYGFFFYGGIVILIIILEH